MAANKNVLVIVFDVGKNATERQTEDGPTFFDQAKKCIENIILRKVLTRPKDEMSLLLIGTETTDLGEFSADYKHISIGFPMAPANWDMIRYVRGINSPNGNITADWLDGILVAMNYLKSLRYTKSNYQIILLATFSTPVLDDNMKTFVDRLKQLKIELIAISSNINHMKDDDEHPERPVFSQTIAKGAIRKHSESILTELIKQCDGTLGSFSEFTYGDKRQTRKIPWNCDLEIGKNFVIKTASYVYLQDEGCGRKWKWKMIAKRRNEIEDRHENGLAIAIGRDSDGIIGNEKAGGTNSENVTATGIPSEDLSEKANTNEIDIDNGILVGNEKVNEAESDTANETENEYAIEIRNVIANAIGNEKVNEVGDFNQEGPSKANDTLDGDSIEMKIENADAIENSNSNEAKREIPIETGNALANEDDGANAMTMRIDSANEAGNANEAGPSKVNEAQSANPNSMEIENANTNAVAIDNFEKVVMKTECFVNATTCVPAPEYIRGYKFAGEFVPYDDDGQLKGARKSMLCTGFTKEGLISDLHLAGTGIWVVVPQKNCPASAKMMVALVAEMRRTKVAMIVRYTNNVRTSPKMMALFPNDINRTYPKHNSLLMHELIFKQNYLRVQFPSFRTNKNKPSADQYAVIDNLIDSMDLTSCETFKRLHDPALLRMYQAIEDRALNPQEPLKDIGDDVKDMLYTPRHLQEQAKPFIEQAKALFPLKEAKKTSRNALKERLQKNAREIAHLTSSSAYNATLKITEVGTATPADDFTELLKNGELLRTLIPQIEKVIDTLAFQSVEVPEEKISKALRVYRDAAKMMGPFRYNEWIGSFKAQMLERDRHDLWHKIIVAERLGLITATESENSTIIEADAEEFYRIAEDNTNDSAILADDDNDVGGMFDDM